MDLLFMSVIIVIVTALYIKLNRKTRLLKHFPNPPGNIILGNILDIRSIKDMLPRCNEYIQKYGENVTMFMGPIPNILIVTDPDLVEYFLTSPQVMKKSKPYAYFKRWLGTGLLISDTDSNWKRHRKIITTAFHNKILENFTSIMKCQCDILIDKLRMEVGKSSVDMVPFITMCSLDIICETIMGTSVNAQQNSNSEYVKSIQTMCQILLKRTVEPLFMFESLYTITSTYRKEKEAIRVLHDFTNSVITKRKLYLDSNQMNGDNEFKQKYAFLDSLLLDRDNKDYLNDDDVRAEVDTFMFAGHDTTSSAVSFTLHLLSENLEVQEKAFDEIKDILSDSSLNFTSENLNKLKYLEAIIKESLRLYPPIAFVGRRLHEDCKYRDMVIPKDIDIIIFTYGVQRNPKYYEHPDDFIPERYLSENISNRSAYSYIPFGGGPRNCIGQKFAMLEMKCILSSILMDYKILPTTPKHKLDLVAEVVLQSHSGICMRLEERRTASNIS